MYYKAIEPKYNSELLNMLNETRGIIDNLTPLINKIVKYISEFIKNDTFILKQIIEGLLRLAGIVPERAELVKTRRQKT